MAAAGAFGADVGVRAAQAAYLAILAAVPVLVAATRGGRECLQRRPGRAVLALLAADLGFWLWVTLPFVPIGVDECFYAINAHVYAGNDALWHCPTRPPLTSLGACLFPWHPPLVGLLLRSAAAWFAWRLADRAVAAPWAFAAPLLVLAGGRLTQDSTSLMSEPYGAALLAGFALAAVRGAAGSLGLLAGLAFLARWPLGWLGPLAVAVAFRRRGWRGAAVAGLGFGLLVGAVLLWTGTEPWRLFGDRAEWRRSLPATVAYFLRPDVGLGVGWSHLVLMFVGGLAARAPAVRWCLGLFVLGAGVVVAAGEATVRFLAPLVPLAAVVATAGLARLGALVRPGAWQRPVWGGVLVAFVAVSVAVPVRPLRARPVKLASVGNVVREGRAELRHLLAGAPLFCDGNFLAVTAVLGHRCHAVPTPPGVADEREPRRFQPPGVGLDLDGSTPPCERANLPAGAFYLTYDPAGREVLWRRGGLNLVRW